MGKVVGLWGNPSKECWGYPSPLRCNGRDGRYTAVLVSLSDHN